MFSLQTIFGKGDKFFGLLEHSAAAARESAAALSELVATPPQFRSLDRFLAARQRQKDIVAQISEQLVGTFVTALEREDIEALSAVLYKIAKAVEKFAERYMISADVIGDVDFGPRAAMLERACAVLQTMTGQLRRGMALEPTRRHNERLQAIESEADRVILDLYQQASEGRIEPMTYLLRKDLDEILEKAIDRCRDAGNVIYQIVLKNS